MQNIENVQNENNKSAKEEILLSYKSIKDFCIQHKIEYGVFLKELNNHPELNLSEALDYYIQLSCNNLNIAPQNIFCGVSVSAICVKYQIDYERYLKITKNGISVEEALFKALAFSPIFSKKISKRIQSVADWIQNVNYTDLLRILDALTIEEELKSAVLLYYQLYQQLKLDLGIYRIVDFIENGWEQLHAKEIKMMHQKGMKEKDFYNACDELKRKTRADLMKQLNLTEENMKNYYKTTYEDYSKVSTRVGPVWSYTRSKTFNL